MSEKKGCVWFLEPIGEYSNEVLVRGLNDMSDENLLPAVVCADRKKHSLIRCDWSYVAHAQRSRERDQALRFKVWNMEAPGPIRLWKFNRPRQKKINIPTRRNANGK